MTSTINLRACARKLVEDIRATEYLNSLSDSGDEGNTHCELFNFYQVRPCRATITAKSCDKYSHRVHLQIYGNENKLGIYIHTCISYRDVILCTACMKAGARSYAPPNDIYNHLCSGIEYPHPRESCVFDLPLPADHIDVRRFIEIYKRGSNVRIPKSAEVFDTTNLFDFLVDFLYETGINSSTIFITD
jgi:hypothetical protein